MGVFFSTFFKVLASLIAIALFFLILSVFFSYIKLNQTTSHFSLIEGNKDSNNKIAILKLQGAIVNNPLNFNNLSAFQIIDPIQVRKKLENLRIINPKVLIISINSPGGTVTASYELYEMLKNYKDKSDLKIYFHTNETLTSGAYWFALAADKIYASYGSLIGSIGVKGPDWYFYDKPISISTGIFGNKIETKNGIKIYSQNAGKSKDLLNPFREPTKEELQNLKLLINSIYNDFVYLVSKKRKIEANILKNKIGALVYNSTHAKNNYLIDEEINLKSLIKKILEKNNFDTYQVLESSNIKKTFIEEFFLKIFLKNNLEKNIITNKFICNKLITNISSIIPSYLSNC